MVSTTINRQEALKRWGQVLESSADALGVALSSEKKAFLAEYASMHEMNAASMAINENSLAYANLTNTPGIGAVNAPQPGAAPGAYGTQGSADYANKLIPVAIKVALKAVGLELVATKNVAAPKIELLFIEDIYTGGKIESATDRPLVFSAEVADAAVKFAKLVQIIASGKRVFLRLAATADMAAAPNSLVGVEPTGSKQGWVEFLGLGRIAPNQVILRAFQQSNETRSTFDLEKNTFAENQTIAAFLSDKDIKGTTVPTGEEGFAAITDAFGLVVPVQYVSAFEDHALGYTRNFKFDAGSPGQVGLNRAASEETYFPVMGNRTFTQSVQIGEYKVSYAVTRQQLHDIKVLTGTDLVQHAQTIMINELTQEISKDITAKIRELAEDNRSKAPKVGGVSRFDFDVATFIPNAAGGRAENWMTITRKLLARIQQAANYIKVEGRVGMPTYMLVNYKMASVISELNGFMGVATDVKLNNNDLYPLGTVGGMQVWVDPYMPDTKDVIYLGRKNKENEPGLLFLSYLMAEQFNLITEGTGASRLYMTSRCAVTKIGFFPEKQFMAIEVTDAGGVLF